MIIKQVHRAKSYWQMADGFTWLAALVFLFTPLSINNGFSFCIFKVVGLGSCPGCGLGHSIHHALHLEISESLNHHILGIPVAIMLCITVIKKLFLSRQTSHIP